MARLKVIQARLFFTFDIICPFLHSLISLSHLQFVPVTETWRSPFTTQGKVGLWYLTHLLSNGNYRPNAEQVHSNLSVISFDDPIRML
jgi:hypothetical protein